MTEDMNFWSAVELASWGEEGYVRGRRPPITAYYPSAGRDTGPITLLRPEWLRRHGIDMPSPKVLVYIDRDYPADPATDELGGSRGCASIMRTRSVEPLSVEGHPASLVTVEVGHPVHGRVVRVLRIRAENEDALVMCRRASWRPNIYIAPDDGCCFGGGNTYRCENSLDPMNTPMRAFYRLPEWWITDHFHPRTPDANYPDGALVPTTQGFPFEIRKLGHLGERWGHNWEPFGGTTLFELGRLTQPGLT